MKNVNQAQSLMNTIMPRMEIKKVNHVQESFKETLTKDRKELKAEPKNDFKSLRSKENLKKQPANNQSGKSEHSDNADRMKNHRDKESIKVLHETEKEPQDLNQQSKSPGTESSEQVKKKEPEEKVSQEKSSPEQEPVISKESNTLTEVSIQQALLQLEKEWVTVQEQIPEAAQKDASAVEVEPVSKPLESISVLEQQIPESEPEMFPKESQTTETGETAAKSTGELVIKELFQEKHPEEFVLETKETSLADQTKVNENSNEKDRALGTGKESVFLEKTTATDKTEKESVFLERPAITDKTERVSRSAEEEDVPEKDIVKPFKITIRDDLDMLKKQFDIPSDLGSKGEESLRNEKALFAVEEENLQFNVNVLKTNAINNMANQTKSVGAQRMDFDLASRVADEVKISLGQNKTEIQIKLYPETLGKLTVKLSSENGVMNASFFAENDKAKLMIESQMAELRKTLESQGIQVQNLTVTVDSGSEELARHKNIMEAQKYSKIKGNEREMEAVSSFASHRNPYLIEDEFTERI